MTEGSLSIKGPAPTYKFLSGETMAGHSKFKNIMHRKGRADAV
ncbi:MAG TPA: YebC/PmpR family DNA-binding transcriptional regulator, partial [Brevundimonas sp.]|nr:YebC/PmpR family DNA-binding transcriptional regulator [Brevundimonas sp.]